jgi:hypothetical protein
MAILIRLALQFFVRIGWVFVIPLVARYGRRLWRWFWE